MVSEDLDDFSVDVVEFDDGTKVQVGSDASSVGSHTSASRTTEPVLPSERFTDDYDRSYPPKQPYHHHHQQRHDNDHTHYKPYRRLEDHGYSRRSEDHGYSRRSEDHGYSSRYNSNYNNRRHSSTAEGGHERRTSGTNDRWTATTTTTASTRRESTDHVPPPSHYGHRRPSYDRKHDNGVYHPTSLLQRPRRLSEQSFRSDHSREDISANNTNPLHIIPEPTHAATENTEEIIVVQKNLMMTAAERAKKRLEEQEAEFKAAAERAKQKADALAAKQAESKEKTILKKPASAASVDTKSSNKTRKVSSPPSSSNATTTQTPKAPLPSKLPDTSKPWNLVAANKQAPSSVVTTTSSSETKDQAKEPSSQTPKEEPLPTPSKEHQPTQILKHDEQKPVTIMKKEPKKEAEQEEDSKSKKPLTEDEKNWQQFVSTIKTDQHAAVKKDVTSMDWNSYADRLQETTAEQDAIAASTRERLIREVEREIELESQQHKQQQHQHQPQPQPVEVLDYKEDWGSAPVNAMYGRHTELRGGAWTREDNAYNAQRGHRNSHRNSNGRGGGGRDVGRASHHTSSTKNRASADDVTAEKEEKPIVVEILKKQEPVLSKKTRLSNLLKESSSPIFPDFIDKLAAKKPANMSFMVETEESDKEITMMGQEAAAMEDETVSVATTHTTTTENSPASTPPKSQFPLQQQQQQQQQHQRRLNVNRHFPVLVYQYPSASTTATGSTSDHLGSTSSSSSSMDMGSKSKLMLFVCRDHHHQLTRTFDILYRSFISSPTFTTKSTFGCLSHATTTLLDHKSIHGTLSPGGNKQCTAHLLPYAILATTATAKHHWHGSKTTLLRPPSS